MSDIKYDIVEHMEFYQRVQKDGQKNLIKFRGMVEHQNMISEIGHQSMRRWEKV